MAIRDKLKAYHAAVTATGATELRYPLSTPDAVTLSTELQDAELRFPTVVRAAATALTNMKEPPVAHEALINYYKTLGELSLQFWDGFEGTLVDGVEVIRSR